MTKICSKCKIEKDVSEFSKNKSTPDGYGYYCIKCEKERKAAWYRKNSKREKDKKGKYRERNPEKITISRKEYYRKNSKREKEKFKIYQKKRKKN